MIDCLVIGGGPAGLTAAIYLARFHLSVTIIDGGQSRAGLIPMTRNHAGFPAGIEGTVLLARMRAQAIEFGVQLVSGEVSSLAKRGEDLVGVVGAEQFVARSVLLATGVVNKKPRMAERTHARALANGLVRYCPICDGFEISDKRVGVIGTSERGAREAQFLRSYTKDVTLIAPDGPHIMSADDARALAEAGIALCDGPYTDITLQGGKIVVRTPSGSRTFHSVYPALGSIVRSDLARQIGASVTSDGCLLVDAHQRTDVAGLYGAGDVVLGLDQISHAMGEGGVAATTMRNDLAERQPLRR